MPARPITCTRGGKTLYGAYHSSSNTVAAHDMTLEEAIEGFAQEAAEDTRESVRLHAEFDSVQTWRAGDATKAVNRQRRRS